MHPWKVAGSYASCDVHLGKGRPRAGATAVARRGAEPLCCPPKYGWTRLQWLESGVFEIRVVTPAVTSAEGRRHAGGVLRVGEASLPFIVDLTSWRIADYERQWWEAIGRVARGASATALITGYAGDGDRPHAMWALWRDGDFVYVQPHIVVSEGLETPFDPGAPEPHVGERIGPDHGLPIAEWRVEFVYLVATAFGLRWPRLPH